MGIEWIKRSEKLPENNQFCFLYVEENDGICGPIIWKDSDNGKGMWIDLFATSEYGTCIEPEQVDWWIDAQKIRPAQWQKELDDASKLTQPSPAGEADLLTMVDKQGEK